MIMRVAASLLFLVACALLAAGQGQGSAGSESSIGSALRARDYQHALQLIQSQLRESPKDVKLWTLEGIAYSRLGNNREALVAYNRALNISPDYLAALEGAAESEYKEGSARAIPLLNRILKLQPDNSTSHAMLAVLAYKQHDCPTAVQHFRASADLISSRPAALAQYGSCLMTLQKADDAISEFQQILRLMPNDPHAQYNLAVAQLTANHGKEAIATLAPLIEGQNPDPDALDLASSAYEESDDTPHAVSLLRQAIVSNPKNAKYYLDFAALSFKHSSFQVGIDMIDVGIKELPGVAALYVARGVLYIQLEQFEKGEADFATANRLDPGQTSGAVAEGLAQIQQSNLDEALATIRSKLKTHPEDAFLHYLEAQVISQNGAEVGTPQFKEAIAAASRAAKLKPDFVLAHDLLGNLYLKSGQLDESIRQSRFALHDSPSDQEALYHLIQALRKSGRDSNELPTLVKRLADLRAESRKTEASENKYKLYEPATSGASDAGRLTN
ncbi:MAG TPA: tetratricopeptide repeat protein [Terriglobales bacterium]|nr:tetratricopeptide repeat protein [Terriglobales bacterium]